MKIEASAAVDKPPDRWSEIRQTLLEQIWKGLFVAALFGAPASVSRALFTGWHPLYTLHTIVAILVAVVYMCRERIPVSTKAALAMLVVYGVGVAGVFALGIVGLGLWWLVVGSLMGSLLYSVRFGILLAVITLSIVGIAGAGFVSGFLTISFDANTYLVQTSSWAGVLLGGALMPLILFQAVAAYQKTVVDLLDEVEQQRDRQTALNTQLKEALADVKTLEGLIPICSQCKKIRDDTGFWESVEAYFQKHTEVAFSHGLCPACGEHLYGELWREVRPRHQDPKA